MIRYRQGRTSGWPSSGRRDGVILAFVAASLVLLIAIAGLAIDIGLAFQGAQQCQQVADAGALAGQQEMPYTNLAQPVAIQVGQANIPTSQADAFSLDVTFYAKGEEVPDVGPAPHAGCIEVTATKDVRCHFLAVIGHDTITVQRSAVASKIVTGTCITPIWGWHTTIFTYGQEANLLLADGPHVGIPGSFGFLQPAGGVSFDDALKGLLTPEQEDAQRLDVGDYVWAYTGLNVGQWVGALETSADSRLERAAGDPWQDDTFESFRADNPRLLIVPMVEYIAGTGAGAYSEVKTFATFWLEDTLALGLDRRITGRFLEYTTPGGTGYGVKVTHLDR